MSAYNFLEPTLREVLYVINPLWEDWEIRFTIIQELRDVVESLEIFRGATVEPFGSFVSNLFTRSADLDMSIQLPLGSCISSAGRNRKQNLLKELLKSLRQRGGLRKLQFVANAKVPILKFESNHQNISCDVSIDNLTGQMKSKVLFWINEIDGRFREMVLLVKEWAKAHDINNPRTGSMNSHSLSLLVIFHFQTCVPPILPPLQDIYPGNLVHDLTGVRVDAERRIGEICASNIARFKSDNSRRINRSSLSNLFISFFAKFSDIRSRAPTLGICTFTGQWEEIANNTRWLPKTYALFIEDPFEQPQNTARAVSPNQLTKISEAFETTYHSLISPNQNQQSLLTALARPQACQRIIGTPFRHPNHKGGRQRRRPPVQQNQSQPGWRHHGQQHQNQPVRPNQSQVQKIWRPKSDNSKTLDKN